MIRNIVVGCIWQTCCKWNVFNLMFYSVIAIVKFWSGVILEAHQFKKTFFKYSADLPMLFNRKL